MLPLPTLEIASEHLLAGSEIKHGESHVFLNTNKNSRTVTDVVMERKFASMTPVPQ
jgi:hypothetical protein